MANLNEIVRYTPPVYHNGVECYIDFYCYDPITKSKKRKKIKLNWVDKKMRRAYARELIQRLNLELAKGWNPWVEKAEGSEYLLFVDCVKGYRSYIDKMYRDGVYRPESHKCYASQLNNLIEWNKKKMQPITYIYQFDKNFCIEFLDEVYLVRDNSAYTHDNYLTFLKSFANWCVSRNHLKANPTVGIMAFGCRQKKKTRTLLTPNDMDRLHDYLMEKNKHYLLGAYLIYYCFIRPAEMCRLRIGDISVKRQTIFVSSAASKNKKDGTITLPAKVLKLMLEIGTFDQPSDYYLFGSGFKPGREKVSEKMFRDYWHHHVRKDLKYPASYKFYSLKDTGITNMLRSHDVLSVRDQARHSSILMTDIYTPHDIQEANELIKNYHDDF